MSVCEVNLIEGHVKFDCPQISEGEVLFIRDPDRKLVLTVDHQQVSFGLVRVTTPNQSKNILLFPGDVKTFRPCGSIHFKIYHQPIKTA